MLGLVLRRSAASAVCVLVTAWTADARAEGPSSTRAGDRSSSTQPVLPVQYGNRSPTLPKRVFRVDVSAIVSRAPATATNLQLTLDAGYGLTDRIEAGFSLPALQLSPTVEGIDPAAYVTAGFTPTSWLTLVPLTRLTAPIRATDLWTIDLNLGVSLNLTQSVQLFTSPTFSISFATPVQSSLLLPLGIFAQLLDRLFIQAQVGLAFDRTSPRFMAPRPDDSASFDETLLVVSGMVGYTVGHPGRTMADILVTWLWPGLVQSDANTSTTVTNDWSLTLGVSVYLPQLALKRASYSKVQIPRRLPSPSGPPSGWQRAPHWHWVPLTPN